MLAIPAETQKAGWCAELSFYKSLFSLFPCFLTQFVSPLLRLVEWLSWSRPLKVLAKSRDIFNWGMFSGSWKKCVSLCYKYSIVSIISNRKLQEGVFYWFCSQLKNLWWLSKKPLVTKLLTQTFIYRESVRMFEDNKCIRFLLCPFGANTLPYIKKVQAKTKFQCLPNNTATGSIKSSVICIPRSRDSVHIPLIGTCMLLLWLQKMYFKLIYNTLNF